MQSLHILLRRNVAAVSFVVSLELQALCFRRAVFSILSSRFRSSARFIPSTGHVCYLCFHVLQETKSFIPLLSASALGAAQESGEFCAFVSSCLCAFSCPFVTSVFLGLTWKLIMYCDFQLIRVQSADGTKRVEVTPGASLLELYESVQKAFQLEDPQFAVYKERNYTQEVSCPYAAQFMVVAHAYISCSLVMTSYFETTWHVIVKIVLHSREQSSGAVHPPNYLKAQLHCTANSDRKFRGLCDSCTTTYKLYILRFFSYHLTAPFILFQIPSSRKHTISSFHLNHGDLLYMRKLAAGSSSTVRLIFLHFKHKTVQ